MRRHSPARSCWMFTFSITVSKNAKNGQFWRIFEKIETFYRIFKQCECGWCWAVASPSRWTRRTSGQWACQWYTITNSVFYLGPLSPAELFLTAGAKNFTVIFFHKCRINSPKVLIFRPRKTICWKKFP